MDRKGNQELYTLGFIGAGNMAQALASGMVNNGVVKPENIWASAPTNNNLQKMKDLGCHVSNSNEDIVINCKIIFLCVKPFKASEVLCKLQQKQLWKPDLLIVSVISGIRIEDLEYFFPQGTRIIRTMPNIPVLVQTGVFVYSLGTHATQEDGKLIHYLLSSLGICEEISENLIDVVCGLSGSGPAYIYTVIQAMSDGAVKMGLPRKLATLFAAQTAMGAAKMILETGKHPDVLRDEVCSPDGTTIYGLHALEKAGIRGAMMDAVEAATCKARLQSHLSK